MPRLATENRRMTGKQREEFGRALIDAYPTPKDLDRMLLYNLDKRLAHLASLASPMPDIVFDVIEKAESEAWSLELLLAARTSNHNNPELLVLAQQFGLGIGIYEQAKRCPGIGPAGYGFEAAEAGCRSQRHEECGELARNIGSPGRTGVPGGNPKGDPVGLWHRLSAGTSSSHYQLSCHAHGEGGRRQAPGRRPPF